MHPRPPYSAVLTCAIVSGTARYYPAAFCDPTATVATGTFCYTSPLGEVRLRAVRRVKVW